MTSNALFVLAVLAPQAALSNTVVLQANGPPVWGEVPELVEELRIGRLDGDERYTFGLISGALLAPGGGVWVADRMLATLRRYAADGEHIEDVGRRGEGPGEFNYLMDLRVLRDQRVAVFDPLATRIHIFTADGQFDDDVRVPVVGMLGWDQNFEVDTAGRMYAVAFEPPGRDAAAGGLKAYWIQLQPDGAISDTIPFPPSNQVGVRTMTALSPLGGTVTGRNDEYSFTWETADGRVVEIRREVEPVEYRPAERAEAQHLEEVFAERNGRDPRRLPERKPIWSSFTVDAEGRVWVERHSVGERVEETAAQRDTREQYGNPERTWGEPVVYDVISPEGRFLGTVRFPESAWASGLKKTELAHARGDEVLVIERGDFDEQYVVKYRVLPGR